MVTPFRLTRRVQFYETDAAGIVHFSWYPRYMEEAEHAMWRAHGLTIHASGSAIGWPRVAITFDYHTPLRFEDEFEVAIEVVAMSARSLRYRCELTRAGTPVATGSMTIVCVEYQPGEKPRAVPIPPEVAAHFAASPDLPEA